MTKKEFVSLIRKQHRFIKSECKRLSSLREAAEDAAQAVTDCKAAIHEETVHLARIEQVFKDNHGKHWKE